MAATDPQQQINLQVTAPDEKVVGEEMTVEKELPNGRKVKVKLLPEVKPRETIVEQRKIWVENRQVPPIGYLFTHDHTGLSRPHIICGSCAVGLLKADNIYDNATNRALVNPIINGKEVYMPRDIKSNSDTEVVQDLTMGGRDLNGVAVGPIFPYKIKCPECSIYYNWRRLKIVMARNPSRKRDSSGSGSSSKREVWGELDNLTLKF